jgi:MFS family permease
MPRSASREWSTVATGVTCAAFLGNMVGATPILVSTMGVFAPAVGKAFHWNRTTFFSAALILTWGAAFTAPNGGRLMDRFGSRWVLAPGVALFALAMMAVSLATGSVAQFLLLYLPLGLLAGIQSVVGYNRVVALWFNTRRGLAIALSSAGVGVGSALTPPLTNWLIQTHGWRFAYQALGGLALMIGLPTVLLLLKEPGKSQRPAASQRRQADTVDRNSGLRAAARTLPFWLLVIAMFLANNALVGTSAHTFPMLTDKGYAKTFAATALSLIAVGTIAGQVLAGLLLDRIDTPKIAAGFFASGLAGAAMLHAAASPALILVGSLLMGAAKGSELGLAAYFVARFYGLRAFGLIYGAVYGVAVIAAGIGPVITAEAYDRLGSYDLAFTLFDVALLISTLMMLVMPAYALPKTSNQPDEPTDAIEEGATAPA